MEAISSDQAPLFNLVLQKCSSICSDPPCFYLKKPPCSPPKGQNSTQDEPIYPSPSKPRKTPITENVFTLNPVKNSNEIKLFKVPPESKSPSQSRSSSTIRKNKSKTQSKKPIHSSFTHTSPSKKLGKPLNFNSPVKTPCLTAERRKKKLFTPVLLDKKRKIPEIQEFCREISLFDRSLNKKLLPGDTWSSFKDTSTGIEESTILGEATPVKDYLKEHYEFTFNSPEPAVQGRSPDENLHSTGFEKKPWNASKNSAPQKAVLSPESNIFVLSSSSELVSDISMSEESCDFREILLNKHDKEMQTDAGLEKVLELLGNEEVIDGLKLLGKFKEIMSLINYK